MTENKLQVRDGSGKFVPGASGNPGGKPALPDEVKAMIKKATPVFLSTQNWST